MFIEALYIRLIIQSIKTKTLHFKKANRNWMTRKRGYLQNAEGLITLQAQVSSDKCYISSSYMDIMVYNCKTFLMCSWKNSISPTTGHIQLVLKNFYFYWLFLLKVIQYSFLTHTYNIFLNIIQTLISTNAIYISISSDFDKYIK